MKQPAVQRDVEMDEEYPPNRLPLCACVYMGATPRLDDYIRGGVKTTGLEVKVAGT
jgi:hypothetical protein